MMKVEVAWHRKNQKLLDRAMNPLYRQKRMLGLQDDSEDETDDPETVVALKESEDCITKGAVLPTLLPPLYIFFFCFFFSLVNISIL